MGFQHSERVVELNARLQAFMDEHIFPREHDWEEFCLDPANLWQVPPWYDDLREKAKAQGLWNLFLPHEYEPWSPGLTNVEIAPLFETMSKVTWAQGVFNCNAPDRGNMEVLAKYGTPEQQEQWLNPLLAGEIRSAYAMTEPQVASSDATNMELEIRRDGDEYVLNGRKWWTTGAVGPRCKVMLVMGKSNPENDRHRQHSTILVPRDTPGVKLVRELRVFDNLHSPGGEAELLFEDARVPVTNMIKGEGCGFEIAQGRLGPGRFQYAMGLVGMAQRCLELMCARAEDQRAARDRPLPLRHRAGPPADPAGGGGDGHPGDESGDTLHLHGQDRRAQHGPAGCRPGHAGIRRHGCLPGHADPHRVHAGPFFPHCRRP
jgi:acyl-CoA dehydrogenase